MSQRSSSSSSLVRYNTSDLTIHGLSGDYDCVTQLPLMYSCISYYTVCTGNANGLSSMEVNYNSYRQLHWLSSNYSKLKHWITFQNSALCWTCLAYHCKYNDWIQTIPTMCTSRVKIKCYAPFSLFCIIHLFHEDISMAVVISHTNGCYYPPAGDLQNIDVTVCLRLSAQCFSYMINQTNQPWEWSQQQLLKPFFLFTILSFIFHNLTFEFNRSTMTLPAWLCRLLQWRIACACVWDLRTSEEFIEDLVFLKDMVQTCRV